MAPGDIVVADYGAFGGFGGLVRVNPASGARSTLSANTTPAGGPSFARPLGVALARNGDALVADADAFDMFGGVIRVSTATGARTAVSSNSAPPGDPLFGFPDAIAIAPNGDILIADQSAFAGFTGGVIRVDPVTGARTTVSSNLSHPGPPLFADPFGIAVAANGDIIVSDITPPQLIRVNAATGTRTLISSNVSGGPALVTPAGIAIAPSGDLLVADMNAFGGTGGVIRVNPVTGARSPVSANGAPAGGPSFEDPAVPVLDSSGRILVVDFNAFGGSGGVIRVDPATGTRTTVSSNAAPAGGPSFVDPRGIAVLPGTASSPARPPVRLADTTAPTVSNVSVSPRAFAIRRSRRHRRTGTTFRYRLSEAARVTFSIEKKTAGRRVRGRCRPPTRRNRKARRCTRYKRAGTFSQQGAPGTNTKRFVGRLRGRRLARGSYRATLRATDAAGNTSPARRVSFRVVR